MNKTLNKNTGKREDHNDEFKFEIINHIGVLGTNSTGWNKELNIVKWNDANPKIDIREWDSEHEKMSRGTSLNVREAEKLRELICDFDFSAMVLG
jgi:hypothetical protein